MLCDAHVHFFSPRFVKSLADQKGIAPADALRLLGWDDPESVRALAGRWAAELDRHGVARAALIASVPGDEDSVAEAVAAFPSRFVGFFMLDPTADDALERARRALDRGLRGICLFPAMHRYALHDERVARIFDLAASHARTMPDAPAPTPAPPRDARSARSRPAVFVHCGVLSVGARKKLGLPSPFDVRFGNPLDLHALALRYPTVPIIVPHFGAGFFREALMLADLCPNVHLDTSSSNAWMRYTPGLTLAQVLKAAVDVAGPNRLLFGTDSSFFPRGWHKAIEDAQRRAAADAGIEEDAQARIFGGNFDALFPVQ